VNHLPFLLLILLSYCPLPAHALIDATLQWYTSDQPPGLANYQEVQRSTDGVNFTTIATLPQSAGQYSDQTVTEGQPTYWRIAAVNSIETSLGNVACATIIRGGMLTISFPSTISGTISLPPPTVDAVGIQYQMDGVNLGPEVTSPPFAFPVFDSKTLNNGVHMLTEIIRSSTGTVTAVTQQITVQNVAAPLLAYAMSEGAGTAVADSAGNSPGTMTGATWTTGHTGSALSFAASGAKLTSAVTAHNVQRTYIAWINIQGAGGGSFGRIFDKRTNGAEVENLSKDGSVLKYIRAWSTGTGIWTIHAPSLNVWHHIAVVYAASSATNKPAFYVDGIPQVVTQVSAPSGVPLNNTDPYVIGNRGAGDRWLNGVVDDFRVYNQTLTASDVQGAR